MVIYQYLEPLLAGKRVLEVGCGTGQGAEHVAHFAQEVLGIDDVSLAIAHARHANGHPNLQYAVGEPDRLDVPAQTFDVVLLPELQRWVTRGGLVPELRRVLVPGGLMVLATPSADIDEDAHGMAYQDLTEYLGQVFGHVRLFGEIPFIGTIMADFAPDEELEPTFDCSLVEEDEPPHTYLALCSDKPVPAIGYTVVQVPAPQVEDAASAERLEDELDGLRQRLLLAEARADEWATKSASATSEVMSRSQELEGLNERVSTLQRELAQAGLNKPLDEFERLLTEKQSLSDELKAASQHEEAAFEAANDLEELRERLVNAEREVLAESNRARTEVTQARREVRQQREVAVRSQEELQAVHVALKEARRLLERRGDDELSSSVSPAPADDLDQARRELEVGRTRLRAAEKTALELHQHVAELQGFRQSEQWRIDEIMGQLRSSEARLATAKAEIQDHADTKKVPSKDLSLLRADLARAQARIVELEARCDQILVELQRVSAVKAEVPEPVVDLKAQRELEELEQRFKSTAGELAVQRQELEVAHQELARLQADLLQSNEGAPESLDKDEQLRMQQEQIDALLDGALLHREEAGQFRTQVDELQDLVNELKGGATVGVELQACLEGCTKANARADDYQRQLNVCGRELALAQGELIKLRGGQPTK
ncbi:MAG: methyltransferase domain-containing protein [Deltaproteobacteria bacterium]|nr:methyltransferase domain-containing protein [Deltaproteobacteria bacterium]